ncbi:hypothetical protein AUM41_15345 [Cronobacter malonaticus]|uniref:hypothetical protein n=1 Tax=Cronobacter malonaticus TaxID=413503 RepID=UPI000518C9DA|nr:hypothetical protein [Cronobacter malonaticus]ELQ6063234.1 hypothetical protein [Cronobacter sakazakii]HDC4406054.1 hypothetical protein [Enterobacter cloacae]EGT4384423.1 hypothetical protein [Cronobacter malonaticus]EGT4422540.1 hypothetical protein [Cronobacter malonaticus]EGT4455621.1 hypothetical protein [Cronobacter malonaticus]
MKNLVKQIAIFTWAIIKIVLTTVVLLVAVIYPAKWLWPISLTLTIVSFALTVLAGTDFIRRFTTVKLKENQQPIDLWTLISIAVSFVGILAMLKESTSGVDSSVYIVSIVMFIFIIFGSWRSNKKKTKKAP